MSNKKISPETESVMRSVHFGLADHLSFTSVHLLLQTKEQLKKLHVEDELIKKCDEFIEGIHSLRMKLFTINLSPKTDESVPAPEASDRKG